MTEKSKMLLSLGAALASLTGVSTQGAEAKSVIVNDEIKSQTPEQAAPTGLTPNAHFTAGDDLLGFVVTKKGDGTVVAQHASHTSHASHASHASSRY
jgi:hypothetical protein